METSTEQNLDRVLERQVTMIYTCSLQSMLRLAPLTELSFGVGLGQSSAALTKEKAEEERHFAVTLFS